MEYLFRKCSRQTRHGGTIDCLVGAFQLYQELICADICVSYLGNNPDVPRGKYFNLVYAIVCISLQFSKFYFLYLWNLIGRVHITSGLDPYGTLDFECGYLDELSCYSQYPSQLILNSCSQSCRSCCAEVGVQTRSWNRQTHGITSWRSPSWTSNFCRRQPSSDASSWHSRGNICVEDSLFQGRRRCHWRISQAHRLVMLSFWKMRIWN